MGSCCFVVVFLRIEKTGKGAVLLYVPHLPFFQFVQHVFMAKILRQGHRCVPLIVTGLGVIGPAQSQQGGQHFDLAIGRRGVDGGAAIFGIDGVDGQPQFNQGGHHPLRPRFRRQMQARVAGVVLHPHPVPRVPHQRGDQGRRRDGRGQRTGQMQQVPPLVRVVQFVEQRRGTLVQQGRRQFAAAVLHAMDQRGLVVRVSGVQQLQPLWRVFVGPGGLQEQVEHVDRTTVGDQMQRRQLVLAVGGSDVGQPIFFFGQEMHDRLTNATGLHGQANAVEAPVAAPRVPPVAASRVPPRVPRQQRRFATFGHQRPYRPEFAVDARHVHRAESFRIQHIEEFLTSDGFAEN